MTNSRAEGLIDVLNELKDRRDQERIQKPKSAEDFARIKKNMAKLQGQMDQHYSALDKRMKQNRPDDEVLRATAKSDYNKPMGRFKGHQR